MPTSRGSQRPPARRPRSEDAQRALPRRSPHSAPVEPSQLLQDYIDQLVTARGAELLDVAQQMARHGSDAISAVDRLLNSRNKHLRLAGTLVLSHVGHPRAVPGLVHALQDDDNAVRLQAAAGLGNHKTRQARHALFTAFPDRSPSISVALLRSMEKMMTPEMANALQAMERQRLAPRVRTEIEQILARSQVRSRGQQKRHSDSKVERKAKAKQPPLASAPWLRLLPGGRCVGRVVPGLEDTVATVLTWRIPSAHVIDAKDGLVRFSVDKGDMSRLVQARLLKSVSLNLERAPGVDLVEDRNLINPLYAFAHAKGLQSLVITGDISSVDARVLGQLLGLRSARPPGYADTLRLHITSPEVFVEFLAPDDYPALRNMTPISRALAACLAALTVSGPTDVFCDPFCGDGSVVVERSLLGPWSKAYAYDLDATHLQTAQHAWRVLASLGDNPVGSTQFTTWQQTRLPLDSTTVDAMAAILSPEMNDVLLPRHIAEISRVLRAGGRAAFLTADSTRLAERLQGSELAIRQTIAVGDPLIGEIVVLVK